LFTFDFGLRCFHWVTHHTTTVTPHVLHTADFQSFPPTHHTAATHTPSPYTPYAYLTTLLHTTFPAPRFWDVTARHPTPRDYAAHGFVCVTYSSFCTQLFLPVANTRSSRLLMEDFRLLVPASFPRTRIPHCHTSSVSRVISFGRALVWLLVAPRTAALPCLTSATWMDTTHVLPGRLILGSPPYFPTGCHARFHHCVAPLHAHRFRYPCAPHLRTHAPAPHHAWVPRTARLVATLVLPHYFWSFTAPAPALRFPFPPAHHLRFCFPPPLALRAVPPLHVSAVRWDAHHSACSVVLVLLGLFTTPHSGLVTGCTHLCLLVRAVPPPATWVATVFCCLFALVCTCCPSGSAAHCTLHSAACTATAAATAAPHTSHGHRFFLLNTLPFLCLPPAYLLPHLPPAYLPTFALRLPAYTHAACLPTCLPAPPATFYIPTTTCAPSHTRALRVYALRAAAACRAYACRCSRPAHLSIIMKLRRGRTL